MSTTLEFLKNPIEFLKAHALSPPDGTPGEVIKAWKIANAGNIVSGANDGIQDYVGGSSTISLKKAGTSQVFSNFIPHPLFTGALTVSLSPKRTSDDEFEQFWLPWESLAITRHTLPAVPDAKDSDNFPAFFMTAGINGCSVFVDGPATQPTVYHAGITGTLHGPADEFWKEQLGHAFRGTSKADHQPPGQVHSHEYMRTDSSGIQKYLTWLNSQSTNIFQIELQSCFGSVVGIRNKKTWSFYLQKNVMTQDIQIVKRSAVTSQVVATGAKQYQMKTAGKAPGDRVERHVTVQPRKFLPDKVTKIYTRRTNTRCRCLKLVEIFPKRALIGDWREVEVRAL